jgi:hypothetical protein
MSGTPERLYRVCPACGTAGAHQSGCDRADDPLPPKPVPEWLTDERERLVDALEVAVVEREAAIDTFGEAKARVNGDASIENIERVAEAEAAYDAACKRVRECRAELLRAAPPPQQTEPVAWAVKEGSAWEGIWDSADIAEKDARQLRRLSDCRGKVEVVPLYPPPQQTEPVPFYGTVDWALGAPCAWCDYSGPGYWQPGTHAPDCPWHRVGGEEERKRRFRAVAHARRAAPPPQQTEPPFAWVVERFYKTDAEWGVYCIEYAEADTKEPVAFMAARGIPSRVVALYRAAPPALDVEPINGESER